MESPTFALLFGVVVLIAVGLAFAQDSLTTYTTTPQIVNETITFTDGTASAGYNGTVNVAKVYQLGIVPESETVVSPGNYAELTRDTNYTIDNTNGAITLLKNTTSPKLNVTYQYYPESYISQPITKTVAFVIPLLLGLVALLLLVKPMQE